MAYLVSVVALYLLSITQSVTAKPCIAFDSAWNLLAFGLDGKDYNATTQTAWTSSTPATDITTTGRPPFDGANTTCYLAQYSNAIYVINGDTANPNSVYIYNAATPGWSMQQTTPGGFDISNFEAVLDHDTNVFYALSKGEMWFLDMGDLVAANSTAITWTDVGPSPYPATYNPVMALANNHVHFLDVPDVPAGSADIFVIHFSWYQPFSQTYPLVSGSGTVPNSPGQVSSLFQVDNTVQHEFAYVPQDSSNTYVINVMNNNTQQLAGPTTKDPLATYFAGVTSLVQLSSSGAVSFLPYIENNNGANSAAAWTPVAALAAAAPASSSSSAAPSSASGKSSGTSTAKAGSSTAQAAGAGVNGASASHRVSNTLAGLLGLAALACLL
ncbi:hypothetical protein FIBSPDRAFT_817720 [Athelia psychrophila]|uniref:Uncharacterized protein n=1 Tax=Athelia psychrophila TaxID=1759441 RepID=A0A166RC35_9AGAM|nr:hypothetical protein FIBSPDRAFT_817720 [Fibularhizoctonia sp. CBS 109695]